MQTQKENTYHASIVSVATFHLPTHLKPHTLIDLHIRHILRAFQIAFDALLISPLCDRLEEKPPNSLPLRLGTNSNNIAKIVSTRVIPNLRLSLLLILFPDPIAVRAQTPVSKISYISEELVERKNPPLVPGVPALRLGSWLWSHPAGNSKDRARL
jgi:hypothetical protein